jgi:hypothetical protein
MKSDLAKLRVLHEAATPGPWVVVTGKNISIGPCPGQRVALCNYDNGPIEKANAALIAAMFNALPDLIAEIEQLRAIAEAVERAPVVDIYDSRAHGWTVDGDIPDNFNGISVRLLAIGEDG